MNIVNIMNMNTDLIIPIEKGHEISIDMRDETDESDDAYPQSPIAHAPRDCPNAPKKEHKEVGIEVNNDDNNDDNDYYHHYYDKDFDKEIDHMYRKAESTNAIQCDDGYFPIGARFLAGRKYYKTYMNGNIVRMKSLLLLVKSHVGWLRTNVQMNEDADDQLEWDIEFVCF